jgi:hypothetical protein
MAAQRKVPCPFHKSQVKNKTEGRRSLKIPFTKIELPNFGLIKNMLNPMVSHDSNVETCEKCNNEKIVTDVTDDSQKYEEAQQKVEQNAEKLLEQEADLGLGGTRTTLIQGSDMLFVGIGFNKNKSYEVMSEGGFSPKMETSKLKGPSIPQPVGTSSAAVVGKQGQASWPQKVGNYTIKCANSFKLLAGAGGATIATGGPLSISAGIIKITGPQVTIGCSTGPLALEGESVTLTGKHISVSPTGGQMFVKGDITSSGNIVATGHSHSESASFVKAACVGKRETTTTEPGNPDVNQVQPAVWGGLGVKAIANSLLDIKQKYENVLVNWKTASFDLMSPNTMINITERFGTMTKELFPWEQNMTGLTLQNNLFLLQGAFPCNYGGMAGGVAVAMNTLPIPVNNFPHTHGVQEMQHTHALKVPAIDTDYDSPEALRSAMLKSGVGSGAASDPTKKDGAIITELAATAVSSVAAIQSFAVRTVSQVLRIFS